MSDGELSILIVDDDPYALELQAHIAAEAFPESRIETTCDPLEAVSRCGAAPFDCVLLDYDMPSLNGLAVATQVRAQRPFAPIILCTGAGDELLAARALQNGITDYIPKSAIRPPALRRTVLHAIHVTKSARLIEEQRRELESFAFALTHDFKQPLRQITTFANLTGEDLDSGELDDARKHLKFLSTAARRLSALVDMMSQYTLLNKPLVPEPVCVGDAVGGVLDSIAAYIQERGAVVDVRGDEVIMGNATFLHQIMQNLIVNGLKYNLSDPPRVIIDIGSSEGKCVIEVGDNGIGIDSEYLEQIFKPLARLHTNAEYAGTGLGLTMARKAASAQGGHVACRSEPGAGSQFTVTLPLGQPQRASA